MRGMPPRGHPLGGAARVPYVRPRRLLRFVRRQARDAALSRNGAPGHALGDARGCLDLVLRPRVRGPPRPGSENARVRRGKRAACRPKRQVPPPGRRPGNGPGVRVEGPGWGYAEFLVLLLAEAYAAEQVAARDRGRILVSRGMTPLQRPRHVSLVFGRPASGSPKGRRDRVRAPPFLGKVSTGRVPP